MISLSKNKWGGNHYLETLFLDFFKWNDSGKQTLKIPQTKPSTKINPDNENFEGLFNWQNDILRFEANSLVGRTENFRGLEAILSACLHNKIT